MTANPDIRWEQRNRNFGRALSRLSDALVLGLEELNELEQEGVIRRFDYAETEGGISAKTAVQVEVKNLDHHPVLI